MYREKTADGTTRLTGSPLGAWPIGSLYFSSTPTNPASLLGGGEWVRYGKGKTFISQDDADPDFDTAGETGGSKTHALTTGEMPSHTHGSGNLTASGNGSHDHDLDMANASGTSNSNAARGNNVTNTTHPGPIGDVGDHTHPIVGVTSSSGSGNAHDIMNPYIVVYVWTRVA